MTKPNKLPAQLAGNLDVPPSVWADSRRLEEHLPEGLIAVYTSAAGLVLDATGAALIPAVIAGRRCVSLVPEERGDLVALLDTLDAEQRSLAQVRLVDSDAVPGAVAAFTDEADLVLATAEVTRAAGWWPAARGALRVGGHAAIVCGTVDVGVHAKIVTGATSAGLAFTQHLVAVSSAVLDEAVAAEAVGDDGRRRRGGKVHARSHRDVYVFRNPASMTGLLSPRQAT